MQINLLLLLCEVEEDESTKKLRKNTEQEMKSICVIKAISTRDLKKQNTEG